MTYDLEFHEKALKEYQSLEAQVKARIKEKIEQRLLMPNVPSAKLRGSPNRFKIKLKRPPIRLVYAFHAEERVVRVLAIGKRERNQAYKTAAKRS